MMLTRGHRCTRRKTCSSVFFFDRKFHMYWPGIEPGPLR